MKITGNEPANASYALYNEEGELVNAYQEGCQTGRTYGLTIRHQFAMAAMQGMLAHSTRYKPREGASSNWHEALSQEALQLADALIAELNKQA